MLASNERTICGEQRQTHAVCRSSHHDRVTKIRKKTLTFVVCFSSLSFIPSMWIYTAYSYTIIIFISLFKMFFSLMVASYVTSRSPLYPPPFLPLTLTSRPFASQILSSAPLPTFPFLSVSYYNSSSPLPLFSTPLRRSVPVYTLLLMIRTVH